MEFEMSNTVRDIVVRSYKNGHCEPCFVLFLVESQEQYNWNTTKNSKPCYNIHPKFLSMF